MSNIKGMSKAHQRQSHKNQGYYQRQPDRTAVNKARRQWRALRDNPNCTVSLHALTNAEARVLRALGITREDITGVRKLKAA